jgi:hypothetical protein
VAGQYLVLVSVSSQPLVEAGETMTRRDAVFYYIVPLVVPAGLQHWSRGDWQPL